jgi:hypothetical protein
MSMNRLVRVSALALTIAALPVLAGCGGNPFTPPKDPKNTLPPDTPLNDTPQNTMIRLQRAYQYQDITNYKNLLSADFRYTFSQATDPTLVTQYGTNWGKDDEVESAQHLLTGFTNSLGQYVGPASNIAISFNGDSYLQDPQYSTDSSAYHAYVPVTQVLLAIDVTTSTGSTTYNIQARHDFYLVRGDAAVLDAGQSNASDRWYIRRWDDLSQPLAAVLQIASANSAVAGSSTFGSGTQAHVSWGGLKDSYYR